MTVRCIYFAPIKLLHSSSRRNATRECERKRPSSGLARVLKLVTGLEVPVMRIPYRSGFLLQKKEDRYRAENPSWMDEEVAPADIPKQWQEARANRRMQFKVGNYRDGSWESNIRLLTGTIKVDWIQLPVEQYLAALPTLKQGVIAGVFRQKGAAPSRITTRRSCNSQSSSPMNCLWRTGTQGSMAYQLFGRRSL